MGNPLTRAGNFTRPITILRRQVTTNSHNEEVEGAPIEVPTLAAVRLLPGRELLVADQVAGEMPKRFILRYRPDPPTIADAIRFDGRDYAIRSIDEIGTREGWEVVAVAKVEVD